jgi:hypothetical protein
VPLWGRSIFGISWGLIGSLTGARRRPPGGLRDRTSSGFRFSGHGAESAVPIAMEMAHIATVEGGTLRSIEEYQQQADGLEAAGLSE